ncbi:MAG: serine/threonine-protein kinase [Ferrimonas sp.]
MAEQVKALYEFALTLPCSHQSQWLASADAAPCVIEEVQQLLASSTQATEYFAQFNDGWFIDDEKQDPFDLLGHFVSHYRVDRLLGQGGMGYVYQGFDTKLHRNIALKLIAPGEELTSTARERLLKEARIASQLEHAHIGSVHEITQTQQGQDVIIMAFYPGKTLQQLLDDDEIEGELVETWLHQLLQGLRYAHRCGVIHRDIKPSNLMILEDGTLIILDFGAAISVVSALNHRENVLGTTSYMSPEQIRQQPTTTACDYWSVGVVLMQLAQKLNWMDNVNPFVWAQNPAASRKVKPDWVMQALIKLLELDPLKREVLVKKIKIEPRRFPIVSKVFSSVLLIGLASLLFKFIFNVFFDKAIDEINLSLAYDFSGSPFENYVVAELDRWLVDFDASSNEINYQGIIPSQYKNNSSLKIFASNEPISNFKLELFHEGRFKILHQDSYRIEDYAKAIISSKQSIVNEFNNDFLKYNWHSRIYTSGDVTSRFLFSEAMMRLSQYQLNLSGDSKLLDEALSFIQQALARDQDPRLLLQAAKINRFKYVESGDLDFLNSAHKLLDSVLYKDALLIDSYLELAELALLKDEFGLAISSYLMASHFYHSHRDVYYGLTRSYLKVGDYESAKHWMDEYALHTKQDWRFYYLNGVYFNHMMDYPRAIEQFELGIDVAGERSELLSGIKFSTLEKRIVHY